MRQRYQTFLMLASIFVLLSALVYSVHYIVFRDIHHIFIYLLGDLAFLPLEVFLVVIVIERVLARRERNTTLQKLNMVIGAFFSEVGNQLLYELLNCFEKRQEICQHIALKDNWTHTDFRKAMNFAENLQDKPNCFNINLAELKAFLAQKRPFLVTLLENPNLLEHDRFTALLWATFHLAEELEARPSVSNLPSSDLEHIAGDMKRVYGHMAAEWVAYAEHLKVNYPFLFSLVVRTHPFQEHPSPVVTT